MLELERDGTTHHVVTISAKKVQPERMVDFGVKRVKNTLSTQF